MLSSDSRTVMLVYRSKNKVKGKGKSAYSYDDFEYNRETCGLCKAVGRKYRYLPAKCWIKFSYLKPEKFMSEEEKKKKVQIDVINFKGEGSNKRKRLEEALFNSFALGEDEYLNVNYAFLEELDSSMYLPDISLDDYKILGVADQK